MAIVSNSSPLISLARIGKLDLLSRVYPEILVPAAVYDEVTLSGERAGAQEVIDAPWLRVLEVADCQAVDGLRLWLGRGESEAIVLAQIQELPLAIDERRGRSVAASLGIETTGTVGLLLAFKKLGLVPELTPLLDNLVEQGIRLSQRVYDSARELAQER